MKLSVNTQNDFLQTCTMVFRHLADQIGTSNPFERIQKLVVKGTQEDRRIFTEDDLQRITAAASPMLRSLILTAAYTALSRSDVCMLRKADVDVPPGDGWAYGWITKKRRKTKEQLEIPILPPLREHIERELERHPEGE